MCTTKKLQIFNRFSSIIVLLCMWDIQPSKFCFNKKFKQYKTESHKNPRSTSKQFSKTEALSKHYDTLETWLTLSISIKLVLSYYETRSLVRQAVAMLRTPSLYIIPNRNCQHPACTLAEALYPVLLFPSLPRPPLMS